MATSPSPLRTDAEASVHCCDRARGSDLADRVLWICPIVSLVAIAGLLWLVGLTFWTALAIAFLITCPVVVAWVLLAERIGKPKPPRTDK